MFEYCNKWDNLKFFADILKQRNAKEVIKSPRLSTKTAIPFIVGGESNENRSNNEFVLQKFDSHKFVWRKIHSFPVYREEHSVVQADHYLYILGGKDVNGLILDKVKHSIAMAGKVL